MKKTAAMILSIVLGAGLLAGCGGTGGSTPAESGAAQSSVQAMPVAMSCQSPSSASVGDSPPPCSTSHQ